MELDFDKEIDALLRQTAQGETAFAAANLQSAHLDADEISAFAENALPEKSRQKYTAHLADCAKCRKNLSNLIVHNDEAASETVHAEKKQTVQTPIPWYRKLFAFPNLAYTMGALVLIFSGIAIFTVLQSVNSTQSFEMSQVSEKQPNGKGMSSDGDALPTQENYSSNSMSSNTAAMNTTTANTMTTNSSIAAATPAPVSKANSNVAVRDEADKDAPAEAKPAKSLNETTDLAKSGGQSVTGALPSLPAPKENNVQDSEDFRQRQVLTQNSTVQNQTTIAPDSRNVPRAPSATLQSNNRAKKLEERKDDEQEKAVESTVSGGKIFKRQNNAWYDSAYRGQTTTNVTRGTKEYKKLDSGLRSIAENLGGTVVVVWKQKAYRIQ